MTIKLKPCERICGFCAPAARQVFGSIVEMFEHVREAHAEKREFWLQLVLEQKEEWEAGAANDDEDDDEDEDEDEDDDYVDEDDDEVVQEK
ncbi:hypothetical protein UCDDS831_g02828 [Diplodia seriata]|uniref:Uncharacterized protein n=1 Tax=Diplodia seriata TaxID=420778 RepID=A0A0G2ELZ5_9PEZI|nr:hypothetical protein UCDDS831_g02828 [Diplodia seriata]